MASSPSPWPLLCVDGGGMRGLLAARVLQELEDRLGRPAGDVFAAGAGTSTGALLVAGALAPTAPPSAAELADRYREMGPRVFGQGLRLALQGDPVAHGRLREVVGDVVGGLTMGGARRRLLLTASDVGRRAPVLLDGEDPAVRDVAVADAVLASAALPGYLPPVRIGDAQLVDGGLWAKDPTAAATAALRDRAPGLVVSLGTGTARRSRARAEGLMELVAATIGAGPRDGVPGVQVLRLEPELPAGVGRLDAAGPGDLAALDAVAERFVREAASELDRVVRILEVALA